MGAYTIHHNKKGAIVLVLNDEMRPFTGSSEAIVNGSSAAIPPVNSSSSRGSFGGRSVSYLPHTNNISSTYPAGGNLGRGFENVAYYPELCYYQNHGEQAPPFRTGSAASSTSRLSAATPPFVPAKSTTSTPALSASHGLGFENGENQGVKIPTAPRAMRDGTPDHHLTGPGAVGSGAFDNHRPVHQPVQTPSPVQPSTIRPASHFFARKDKSMKDIIISSTGVICNSVRVVEQQVPGNPPRQIIQDIFNPSVYDFVTEFKNSSPEIKENLLAKNCIDIQVHLNDPEEDALADEKLFAVKGAEKKKAETMGDGQEKAVSSDPFDVQPLIEALEQDIPEKVTVLDVLQSLGSGFVENVKRLTITLIFPNSTNPVTGPASSHVGPIPQVASSRTLGGVPQNTPNFRYLTKVVDYLHNMSSLTQVSINLLVTARSRMPLSMLQLYHVLPFYDLGFINWDVKYQPSNLSVPLKVHGWAISQLDRERDQIIAERFRRAREAVSAAAAENSGGPSRMSAADNLVRNPNVAILGDPSLDPNTAVPNNPFRDPSMSPAGSSIRDPSMAPADTSCRLLTPLVSNS
ncbi:hypothetical protein LZ554_008699 [Drepanopeziza brunnea f. sp. 'monogermtubi']|nr:hypothetical protein LZ554_008699 [Drepanopeziza brunnea f. sp. 'monogermtubi']